MQVIGYQMRRNGVEIARELLGDEARNIGELCVGVFEDGDRRRPTKGARLQRDAERSSWSWWMSRWMPSRHRAWSSR